MSGILTRRIRDEIVAETVSATIAAIAAAICSAVYYVRAIFKATVCKFKPITDIVKPMNTHDDCQRVTGRC